MPEGGEGGQVGKQVDRGEGCQGDQFFFHLCFKALKMVWGTAPVPKCGLLANAPGLFPLGES